MKEKIISLSIMAIGLLSPSFVKEPIPLQDNPYDVYENSRFVNMQNKKSLLNIANFQLKNKDIRSMGHEMAQIQFEKKQYFLALASQAEGFQPQVYHDNKGFAFGTGWNLTKQSREYNKELAKAVFKDEVTIATLTNMSGQYKNSIHQEVSISPQKSLQITYLMGENIKKEIVLKKMSQFIQETKKVSSMYADKMADRIFSKLHPNQQDALIYHAYKVGPNGFLKYKKLLSSIIAGSPQNAQKEFNYTYQVGKKTYQDKQASQLVSAMFKSPQEFGKIFKTKQEKT